MLTDEKLDIAEGRCAARLITLAFILTLSLAACAPRRLNVMLTPEQNLIAIGYSAERSGSIFRANNDAREYCERQKKSVEFIKEDTVYQGHFAEDVTVAARTAGRVAGALGSAKGAQAGRALSSPTDYKTTFEFVCK